MMRKNMKNIMITGIVLLICTFASSLTASADSNGSLFEVDASLLNMRSGPTHEAPIVGQLEDGDQLRTFEEQNGWVKTFFAGEPVWVNSEYLKLIKEDHNKEDENIEDSNSISKTVEEQVEKENDVIFSSSEPIFIDLPKDYEFFLESREVKISEHAVTVTKEILEDYHIVLDAGHGGHDSGGTNNGLKEKDLTIKTASVIGEMLEEKGAKVSYTREESDKEFISLQERVKMSNKLDADAFISLHYDWFDDPNANGIGTYFYHNNNKSLDLAKSVHSSLIHHVDMKDRGVRNVPYYVLRNNQEPAILLELGFISNPNNFEVIQKDEYREKVAEAITNGLIEYFSK
ncbi:N-acetylmuramoyl-L-alanine amidase [Ornithinibacillus halophilus]|uniref:N-acetylmuramoyl-L-alanine amidase n=1 Tax=Ornithinibacillus halophilus TaxID=930117 RepID=A0A1M5J780_9BACI|nr:N-acetylmuramoyl-L-alanine amidase [Ornithinibacillus halophilus]SHG36418.1 N-acetylmuramoyl-L-alanine amidase [Ornithinibacillus halophilus]